MIGTLVVSTTWVTARAAAPVSSCGRCTGANRRGRRPPQRTGAALPGVDGALIAPF